MPTIKIIENTAIAGEHKAIGEVLEVDALIARQLLVAGKAVPCAAVVEKPVTRKKKAKG